MSSQQTRIGSCPHCGTVIPSGEILIEYERYEEEAVYAECPDCEEVVRPE